MCQLSGLLSCHCLGEGILGHLIWFRSLRLDRGEQLIAWSLHIGRRHYTFHGLRFWVLILLILELGVINCHRNTLIDFLILHLC